MIYKTQLNKLKIDAPDKERGLILVLRKGKQKP